MIHLSVMGEYLFSRFRESLKAIFFLGLILFLLPAPPAILGSEGGKVVVLPFNVVAKEDLSLISKSVPRLFSSRLSEETGWEVTLGDEKEPLSALKATGADYAVAGTITKLGRAYSLDLILFDVKGQRKGGFYTSADNIDKIIGGLDELAQKVSKSLTGVEKEGRSAPTTPSPQQLENSPKPSSLSGDKKAGRKTSEKEFTEITRVSDLGDLPGVINRVAAGDIDGDGVYEVAFMGRHRIYFYRFEGEKIKPLITIDRGKGSHLINIDTFDIDGDGVEDFIVTELSYSIPTSFVVGNVEGRIKIKFGDLRGYLAVFEGYGGKKTLVVQDTGFESPYADKAYVARLEGKKLKKGAAIRIPMNEERVMGIVGMNAFSREGKQRFILIDQYEKLRVSNPEGQIFWKSSEYYSGALDFFESSDLDIGLMEKKRYYLAGRLKRVPSDAKVLFLAREAPKPLLSGIRSFSWSRVVLLEWDGDGFVRKIEGKKVNGLISDCALIRSHEGKLFFISPLVVKNKNIMKKGKTKIYLFELGKG